MKGYKTHTDFIRITGVTREEYNQLEEFILREDLGDQGLLDTRDSVIKDGRSGKEIAKTRGITYSEGDYLDDSIQFIEYSDSSETTLFVHLTYFPFIAPEEYSDYRGLEVPPIGREITRIIRETYQEPELQEILKKYGI